MVPVIPSFLVVPSAAGRIHLSIDSFVRGGNSLAKRTFLVYYDGVRKARLEGASRRGICVSILNRTRFVSLTEGTLAMRQVITAFVAMTCLPLWGLAPRG